MFGNYQKRLDEKNRFILPNKFRKSLSNIVYVTLGPDKILEIRDAKSFHTFSQKLLSNNMMNKDARKLVRFILGNTIEIELDKQGRILLPETILKSANILDKEIVILGIGDKLEIWSQSNFENYNKIYFKNDDSVDKLTEKLLKDGVVI